MSNSIAKIATVEYQSDIIEIPLKMLSHLLPLALKQNYFTKYLI
jgi:hypothetical protein